MKRVLFLVQDAAGWAGTERVLNLVASSLATEAEVTVLSLSNERSCAYPYPETVRLSWLPVRGGVLAANLNLAFRLLDLSPDVLILTGLGEVKYLLASLLFRRWRFLAWEHFNAAYTWRRLNRRLVARTADAIVALTDRDADDWRRLLSPCGKVLAIPNPVPSIPADASNLVSRRILAVGRLEPQKRFGLLIEAFSLAAPDLPEWTLRIRGAGSEAAALREQAIRLGVSDRVEILPPTADIAGEYASASIYAMSSRFEGFPMVLLEAMAAGLPCVSVDCPNGPREIIRDGVDGILTPFGEAAPLASAISRLAIDGEMRERMGRAARENITRYKIENIKNRWQSALESH